MTDSDDRASARAQEHDPHRQPESRHEFRSHWVSVLLLGLTVLTIGFGFTGFVTQTIEFNKLNNRVEFDWTIPAYRTVQLLILNSGTEEPDNVALAIARVLAAITFVVLTAAVATKVFHESTQLPVRMMRTGHTVICGLGQIGVQLLEDLHAAGLSRRVVVIERDEQNFGLDQARRMGADIVLRDASRSEALREARAHCAKTVFIVTGDDGTNLEIAAELAEILQPQPRVRHRQGRVVPLRIGLHLQDVKLAEAFRALSCTFPAKSLLDLSIFSVARTSATHVATKQLWPYAPKSSDEVAHFVILGFGTMGRALAVTLARLGHFPNLKRNRFTIADQDYARLAREFLSRFGRFTAWDENSVGVTQFDHARDLWSCREESVPASMASEQQEAIDYVANAQFRALPPDMGDESFSKELLASVRDPNVTVKPVIFVCGQHDRANFHDAVRLRDTLDRLGGNLIPIFVWLPRQPALAKALAGQAMIIPFGACRDTAGLEEVLNPQREQLARVVHQYYQQRAVAAGTKSSPEAWDEVREEYRESNRQFADHFDLKLAHLGYRLVNPLARTATASTTKLPPIDPATANVLAQMEHSRWVAERLMGGWRYAPRPSSETDIENNKQRKWHHDLVSWESLGADQDIDLALLQAILDEARKSKYRLEPIGNR
ncbi:MAG: NAD-binding protein [Planctomycetaceae bacterium]|nr:NAD-binding protein [Planctomycetaceae bacterium]